MIELKPCPFCGHKANFQFLKNEKNEISGYWIMCSYPERCGVHTYVMGTKEEVAHIWNNRVADEN